MQLIKKPDNWAFNKGLFTDSIFLLFLHFYRSTVLQIQCLSKTLFFLRPHFMRLPQCGKVPHCFSRWNTKKLAQPIHFLSWKYCVGHMVCLIILYLFHSLSCYTNTVETFMQTIRFTIAGSNKKANTEKTVHFVEISSDALQRSSVGHCQHTGCCKLYLQTQRNSLV